jgi:hypothetical protein
MTAREWVATLRRRWYVLAAILLCTTMALWVVHKRAIAYQACNILFVTAPPTQLVPNVYTNDEPSLIATTGIVTRQVMSQPVQARLRAEGVTASYDAEMRNNGTSETPQYGEPTLQVCSSSTDPAMAIRTTGAVTTLFGKILHDRQVVDHVPHNSYITLRTISPPTPTPVYGRPSQAYLGVGLIGLVVGVTLPFWIEPLLDRWQRRRRQPAAPAPAD